MYARHYEQQTLGLGEEEERPEEEEELGQPEEPEEAAEPQDPKKTQQGML